VDWIHLAQDMDQWRSLVNIVIKPWVLKKGGEFFHYLSDYWLLKRDSALLHGVS
jgi:hypothetical protein